MDRVCESSPCFRPLRRALPSFESALVPNGSAALTRIGVADPRHGIKTHWGRTGALPSSNPAPPMEASFGSLVLAVIEVCYEITHNDHWPEPVPLETRGLFVRTQGAVASIVEARAPGERRTKARRLLAALQLLVVFEFVVIRAYAPLCAAARTQGSPDAAVPRFEAVSVFWARQPFAFMPLAAAHGALVAGAFANRIFYTRAVLREVVRSMHTVLEQGCADVHDPGDTRAGRSIAVHAHATRGTVDEALRAPLLISNLRVR
jgi:hypothetical protein